MKSKETAPTNGQMVNHTLGSGLKTRCTGRVCLPGWMERFTKDNLWKTGGKEKENLFGLMDDHL